jgi:hypothetical protein
MSNSAYNLLKILKDETPKEDKLSTADLATGTAVAGGKGLLAKKMLDKSLEQILGAKRFYHGTSDEAAKSILREGLDPNKGGNPKGTASIHGRKSYIIDSTGKVHIATNTLGKFIAKMHAAIAQNASLFSRDKGKGKVIKGYMPFMDFVKNFEKDPDHMPFHAFRSTSKVDPSTFVGSGVFDRYKTLFGNSAIKDGPAGLLKYLISHPLRATKGLAFLTGGGLLADSALDNIKELVDKAKKSASAMGAGSFMPPEPLPNSVKAKQMEQQELAAQQGEQNAGAGNEQLMQMQKAQEDAVNQLQQTQQQLAQAQAELQNSQAQAQQQQQATQMQAQQEIQKAQMDAQYELQSEKIKNQQKLLSVQEKYMRSAGKAKPDQNHILSSQLKRVVRKVNGLKVASAPATPLNPLGGQRDSVTQKRDSDIFANEKKFQGLPHSSVLPSQRTQEQWNEISNWKKNRIQTDPRMQQAKSQVMAAPSKTPGLAEGFGTSLKDYLDNPWKETETFKDNAFGQYDESSPGFFANVRNNFKNNPLGTAGRAATNFFTGYVPNLVGGGVEAAKGVYHGDPTRALKGVGTAGLGLLEGATTYGTMGTGGALTKMLQAPGRALASGASRVLPAAVAKPFQWGVTKGVANIATQVPAQMGLYAGADKLGLGDPNMYNENNDDVQTEDYQDMNDGYSGGGQAPGGVPFPGGFSAPQPQQRWDAGLSPSERFSVLNKAANILNRGKGFPVKSSAESDTNQLYKPPVNKEPEYPDIRTFMKNPPPPGEYISSPIPIWQAGFKQQDFNIPKVRNQGYGPLGDFIKQLIFQVGMPMLGMRNPLQPDFSRLYGSLANNEAYKLKVPQTFNYY